MLLLTKLRISGFSFRMISSLLREVILHRDGYQRFIANNRGFTPGLLLQ